MEIRINLQSGGSRGEEIVDGIVQEIVSCFHPKSVIVSGGFGRNEASVIEDGGKLRFLSDCEIAIVSHKPISQKTINRLALDLTQKTGLEIVLHNSIMLLIYSRLPMPSIVSHQLWKPSIVHYELKHGSKVAFGENILERIPDVKPQDIPLWEGIKLMFNRMAALLEFSPINGLERDKTIYWINKLIFACQDALLLSTKQYHYSYKARNLMFQELFPHRFSQLNEKLPKFLSLAAKATAYKLRPDENTYFQDITELWFDTAEICDSVFRYIIEKDAGITFDTYVEFRERYLQHPNTRGRYYLGTISLPIFQNAVTALRMITTTSYKLPALRLITSVRTTWKHIVYSIIPLVYFGLSPEGIVNELQLKQARDTISLFKKLRPQNKNLFEEWKYIKGQAFELWRTLCY